MATEKSNKLEIHIIVFNCKEEVQTYEDTEHVDVQPINNFVEILENRFKESFVKNGNHLLVYTPDYKIYCGIETNLTLERAIDIYGEAGLYEFISLAKENDWKIFDTGLNRFFDLDFPKDYTYLEYYKKELKNTISDAL